MANAATDPEGVLSSTPWLGDAIDADVAAGRFARWGRSTVIDELARQPVIDPPVFAALHARAGIDARWPVGNAGLLHVYGYLLSAVPTPYGLKRARWLDGALAGAYGLPRDAFFPWTASRTLLDRVTEVAEALLRDAPARTGTVGAHRTTLALSSPSSGTAALVYAVDDLLVTTFSVASPDDILSEWDSTAPRLRWNAASPAR